MIAAAARGCCWGFQAKKCGDVPYVAVDQYLRLLLLPLLLLQLLLYWAFLRRAVTMRNQRLADL
jgi:hypothetical protein